MYFYSKSTWGPLKDTNLTDLWRRVIRVKSALSSMPQTSWFSSQLDPSLTCSWTSLFFPPPHASYRAWTIWPCIHPFLPYSFLELFVGEQPYWYSRASLEGLMGKPGRPRQGPRSPWNWQTHQEMSLMSNLTLFFFPPQDPLLQRKLKPNKVFGTTARM